MATFPQQQQHLVSPNEHSVCSFKMRTLPQAKTKAKTQSQIVAHSFNATKTSMSIQARKTNKNKNKTISHSGFGVIKVTVFDVICFAQF